MTATPPLSTIQCYSSSLGTKLPPFHVITTPSSTGNTGVNPQLLSGLATLSGTRWRQRSRQKKHHLSPVTPVLSIIIPQLRPKPKSEMFHAIDYILNASHSSIHFCIAQIAGG